MGKWAQNFYLPMPIDPVSIWTNILWLPIIGVGIIRPGVYNVRMNIIWMGIIALLFMLLTLPSRPSRPQSIGIERTHPCPVVLVNDCND